MTTTKERIDADIRKNIVPFLRSEAEIYFTDSIEPDIRKQVAFMVLTNLKDIAQTGMAATHERHKALCIVEQKYAKALVEVLTEKYNLK